MATILELKAFSYDLLRERYALEQAFNKRNAEITQMLERNAAEIAKLEAKETEDGEQSAGQK